MRETRDWVHFRKMFELRVGDAPLFERRREHQNSEDHLKESIDLRVQTNSLDEGRRSNQDSNRKKSIEMRVENDPLYVRRMELPGPERFRKKSVELRIENGRASQVAGMGRWLNGQLCMSHQMYY